MSVSGLQGNWIAERENDLILVLTFVKTEFGNNFDNNIIIIIIMTLIVFLKGYSW